jgi:hypothetical protein
VELTVRLAEGRGEGVGKAVETRVDRMAVPRPEISEAGLQVLEGKRWEL